MKQEFQVGETVWMSKYGQTGKTVKCPVCFGDKTVVVILGDGTHVKIPCGNCSRGGEPPSGVVNTSEFSEGASQQIVGEVQTIQDESGIRHEYFTPTVNGSYYTITGRIFKTEEEALADSAVKAEEANKMEQERLVKMKPDKSYAYNVGYHLKEARYHEKWVKIHRDMAVICKERSRP